MLVSKLTPEQTKSLQEILCTAELRKINKQSKDIQKSGGNIYIIDMTLCLNNILNDNQTF